MYRLIKPLLFSLNPETAHHQALLWGKFVGKTFLAKPFTWCFNYEHASLKQSLWGQTFANPVGLAAGFDKNADLLDFLPSLGFGFLEIGSVTAKPSAGNPLPRVFRLPQDRALINRLGLPNIGAQRVAEKLIKHPSAVPLGINIAKTPDPRCLGSLGVKDFAESFAKLGPLADYVVLNISCPNTNDGKTFEETEYLEELLNKISDEAKSQKIKKPILLKLSPDLTFQKLESLFAVSEKYNIGGFVVANTTQERTHLKTSSNLLRKIGAGGLSGAPLHSISVKMIQFVKRNLPKKIIIGVGGIFSSLEAYEKIKAGASLVQIYTGLIYQGPGLVKSINQGLVKLLKQEGYGSITEAIGSTHR
ncbi:MAG: quinone-dependent dihydroorotate dehydrogenase [Deltaproteobacteria bacterium]|nr:quinone-dependent dihydroorotate dehydrogenase [Deltaproteobacteria bacterium]